MIYASYDESDLYWFGLFIYYDYKFDNILDYEDENAYQKNELNESLIEFVFSGMYKNEKIRQHNIFCKNLSYYKKVELPKNEIQNFINNIYLQLFESVSKVETTAKFNFPDEITDFYDFEKGDGRDNLRYIKNLDNLFFDSHYIVLLRQDKEYLELVNSLESLSSMFHEEAINAGNFNYKVFNLIKYLLINSILSFLNAYINSGEKKNEEDEKRYKELINKYDNELSDWRVKFLEEIEEFKSDQAINLKQLHSIINKIKLYQYKSQVFPFSFFYTNFKFLKTNEWGSPTIQAQAVLYLPFLDKLQTPEQIVAYERKRLEKFYLFHDESGGTDGWNNLIRLENPLPEIILFKQTDRLEVYNRATNPTNEKMNLL